MVKGTASNPTALTKDEGEGHNEMCPEWLKFVQVSFPWLESCLCASLAMNAAVELEYSLLNALLFIVLGY